jgi:3-oxoacyl-[acyl-carrier-protein] synthase II
VDGYLRRGPQGLSALLFPNTVMNTMAATATIAVGARAQSLTLNAPCVAGELAVARAAALLRAGRVEAVLAGGVDEVDPILGEALAEMGGGDELRGEGAGFVLLESEDAARRRGARVLGEIAGAASRALPARPYGVGRRAESRAVAVALEQAGIGAGAIGRVFASASGDGPRDRWEEAILDAALAPHRPPRVALAARVGRHAGAGALSVAAAALAGGGGAALVHAVARGGTHVALVVQSR